MRQRIFSLVVSFLVLCTISARTENDLDVSYDFTKAPIDEEWRIEDTRNFRQDRAFAKREIDANKIGCWRYCVRKRIIEGETANDSIKRVNIIWNIVNEARVTLTGKTLNSSGISPGDDKDQWESSTILPESSNIFYDDDPKCELYIELGCESFDKSNSNVSTRPDEFSNIYQEKIASKNHEIGFSSRIFSVNEVTERLKILAFGKLSQAILEIPIAQRESDFRNARRTRPTFSLSRTSDAKGLLIDARNPPPGRWQLNLSGIENSNYNFSVSAISSVRIVENVNVKNEQPSTRPSASGTFVNDQEELDINANDMLSRPQRLADLTARNYSARAIRFEDVQLINKENFMEGSEIAQSTEEPFARELMLQTNETKYNGKENLENEFERQESEKTLDDENIGKNARILADSEHDEISRITDDISSQRKRTIVDLDPSTELVRQPGTFQDIVFTVTNNQAVDRRHIFRGSSRPFPYIGVIPYEAWFRAGETINVAVRIQVPNVKETVPSIVTLFVGGSENFEFVEKSTYVYVQGSDGTTTDTVKPNIDYSFNDNCAGKLHRDRCAKSRWSVEITVDDPDSGLKRLTSQPNGIEPRTKFIGGTKEKVIFYYSSTCCYTTVDIKATDVQGNFQTITIDVTAWDNLSQGEIAAIIVGALLIILLIIFIILMIVYCVRRRKSHDLSYSQRYGSRTPASAERTNF